ncbi:MAG: CBS domain-containing protein [Motiliproteus sp.]|nr:CBS domain-containing protein [Motiliproteus sp.]MCW9051727.1 CBS domain-containing protein [Motiliproteus sp.]
MALVIYDHGYRIQTPVSSVLPNRTVEQMTEMHSGRGIPSSEHQVTPPESEIPAQQRKRSQGNKAKQAYADTAQLNRRQTDRPNFAVNRIMTRPVITVTMDASLNDAWNQMTRYQIKHLAVIAAAGRLMGVLTERDLLRRSANRPHQGPVIDRNDIRGGYSTQMVVASPDTPVRQIALVMFDHKVSCIPIVEDNGHLVGMVTRSDMLPLIANDRRFEQWI